MKKEEWIINWGFGLSLIYWGIAGFYFNQDIFFDSLIRIFTTVLNVTVGFLLISRKPVVHLGVGTSVLISLPSVICGGLMFKLAKSLHLWGSVAETIFIIGGIITLTSFLFLGRNFSILPSVRGIVSKGTFSIIRHPAYFGEFIMILGCFWARENMTSLLPLLIFIPGIIYRINEEERLLSKSNDYIAYKQQVKWRLLPYVW